MCDPVDEAAHDYRYDSRHGELRLAGSVAIGPAGGVPLADAGRLIFGGESFRVRSRAGRELVIVMRTRSSIVARGLRAGGGLASEVLVPEAGLLVSASGQPALRVTLANAPGWNEHVLRLPKEARGRGLDAPRAARPLRVLPVLVLPISQATEHQETGGF